jgi:diguanylate cyclase (GGDEF)-like protein
MQELYPMIAELPGVLTGTLSVVAATVISFIAIVLISSYYRFQHIVQKAEHTQPDEMGVPVSDVLRVQLARYLSGCAGRGTSFSVCLVHLNEPVLPVHMEGAYIRTLKQAIRHHDITCVYDRQTAALLMEMEPEDSVSTLTRVISRVTEECAEISDGLLRVGMASYPGHGLAGGALLKVAAEALGQTDDQIPVFLPEITEEAEDEEEEAAAKGKNAEAPPVVETDDAEDTQQDSAEEHDEEREKTGSSWAERRKTAMLDGLTGVLKPSAVSSYMQRMMNDLRHKHKKAALFCIGINNIDHIARIHGEEAVDDVLVGISRILQDNVRATDLIGRHEKYAFLILAEVSLRDAEVIGKRISTQVQQAEIASGTKKLKTTVTLGVATYPEHGRNLHLLYKAGQKVLDYNRENDIRAYAVYDPEIHDKMPSKPMKNIKSVKA